MALMHGDAGISRRRLLQLGIGVGGAVALSGCAGFGLGRTSSGTLDVAWWGGGERAEVHEKALRLFEERNPGITIKPQFADQGPFFERLTTAAAAGNLPDVFWLTSAYLPRYAGAGHLLNLEPHFGKTIDVSHIPETTRASGRIGDGVYGLTYGVNSPCMITNDARLDEAGVDFSKVQTWDDLAAAGAEVTDPSSSRYGIVDTTLNDDQRAFEAWVRQSGSEFFTAQGKIGFTADHLASWWTYWDGMRKAGTIPPPDFQVESDAAHWTAGTIVTGAVAIRPSDATHLEVAQPLTEDPLSIHGYPLNRDGADDWEYTSATYLAIDGKTANVEAATKLMNFLVNDVDSVRLTQVTMGVPTSTQVLRQVLPEMNPARQKVVEYVLGVVEGDGRVMPLKPEGAEQVIASIRRAAQEVAYGRQSITDAAAKVIADVPGTLR